MFQMNGWNGWYNWKQPDIKPNSAVEIHVLEPWFLDFSFCFDLTFFDLFLESISSSILDITSIFHIIQNQGSAFFSTSPKQSFDLLADFE